VKSCRLTGKGSLANVTNEKPNQKMKEMKMATDYVNVHALFPVH